MAVRRLARVQRSRAGPRRRGAGRGDGRGRARSPEGGPPTASSAASSTWWDARARPYLPWAVVRQVAGSYAGLADSAAEATHAKQIIIPAAGGEGKPLRQVT